MVDSIEKLLPKLKGGLPASVKLEVLTDLSNTICASVKEVEFELALTICLVILVIFVFLISFTETIIPTDNVICSQSSRWHWVEGKCEGISLERSQT